MRLATGSTGDGDVGGGFDGTDSCHRSPLTAWAREAAAESTSAELGSDAGRLAALACLLEVAGRPERARRLHTMRAGGDAAFPTVFTAAAALIAGAATARAGTH